jgi:hypothetical protein
LHDTTSTRKSKTSVRATGAVMSDFCAETKS